MKKLAVIIPAYRESENILALCDEILSFWPTADILIVDDSPDNFTVDAVENRGLEQVSIIHRETKGGRGSAVVFGISQYIDEEYDFYLEMDADFSHQPSEIPSLVTYAENESLDILIASRYLAESKILNWSLSRRLFSRLANVVARFVLNVPVKDYTNGFRLYSKPAANIVVDNCGQLGSGFIILSEILVNIHYRGCRVGEIQTEFLNRVRGESSLSLSEIWSALVGLIKIHKLKKELVKCNV